MATPPAGLPSGPTTVPMTTFPGSRARSQVSRRASGAGWAGGEKPPRRRPRGSSGPGPRVAARGGTGTGGARATALGPGGGRPVGAAAGMEGLARDIVLLTAGAQQVRHAPRVQVAADEVPQALRLDGIAAALFGPEGTEYQHPFEYVDAALIGIELDDFARAIRSGRPAETGGDGGPAAVTVGWAVAQSQALGDAGELADVASGAGRAARAPTHRRRLRATMRV